LAFSEQVDELCGLFSCGWSVKPAWKKNQGNNESLKLYSHLALSHLVEEVNIAFEGDIFRDEGQWQ